MIAIADSTPLNYLVLIGAVDLLPKLYGRILAPEAVVRELTHPLTPEVVRTWATSPPLCVTLLHPDLRFFARNTGAPLAMLKVDVITTVLGIRVTTPMALLPAGQSWQPTLPLPFLTNLVPITDNVQFRFTAIGSRGSWQIDDAYVDPFKER